MDFGKLFELLIDKIYNGGTEALITIFLFLIAYLILELRKLKTKYNSLLESHKKEREEFYKLVEKMNDKFLARDEEIIKNMRDAMKESTNTTQNIKTVLANFITYISDSDNFKK